MSRLTFKYRLYPNRQQREKLAATLNLCRELYNAGLQERREALSSHRKSVPSQVLQDTLRRLDKTFKAFFLRCQRGQVQGFPRFRSESRYDSFTSPQSGFQLQGRLSLSKIGAIKIKLHRSIRGAIKTLTLKRENGMWYACFSCLVGAEPLPVSDQAVGIDVGLHFFAVPSDGTAIENPRPFKKMEKRLRRAQRRVARRKKFSQRWKKAVRMVGKMHRQAFHQRNDFQHKWSRDIVNHNGTIVVEDLNVKGLSRGRFAKSVQDVGWAGFFQKLSYKAASAGRLFLRVDPRGTSQRCPCGEAHNKVLRKREHVCVRCGLVTTRDHASALEILRLGLSLKSLTAV